MHPNFTMINVTQISASFMSAPVFSKMLFLDYLLCGLCWPQTHDTPDTALSMLVCNTIPAFKH